jgi:hypothetical protein
MAGSKMVLAVMAVTVSAVLALLGVAAAGPRGRPAPPPPPPPPDVTLTLDAPQPDSGWTVRLSNTGADLVRIVADTRLLSFEVVTAGHTHHCALPPDMIPTTDTERTLVVPAGRSWSMHVDPVLYCFALTDAAALVPGAVVTASFGWPQAHYTPPFAVTPTTLTDGGAGPTRRVSAQPVTLAVNAVALDGGAIDAASVDASAAIPSNAYPVQLKASLPERLDVSRAFEQTVTVTFLNEGTRPVYTLITPPTIGFIVQPPTGPAVRCGADTSASAIAELTTTLAVRARTAVGIDLGTTCGSVMRRPGLYRVRPRLDTRRTAPPTGSLSFWQGETIGAPMIVRIRAGEDPVPTPRLDPAPATVTP